PDEVLERCTSEGLLLVGKLVADHAVEVERAGTDIMTPVDNGIDAAGFQAPEVQIRGTNEIELAVRVATQQLAELVCRGIARIGSVLVVALVDSGLAVDRRDDVFD